jgi:hypothetical protein
MKLVPAISRWLGERPHRATLVNLLMLSAVLALAGSPGLQQVVGGGAVLAAALHFLWRALGWSLAPGKSATLFEAALAWIPGLLAIALALVGIRLTVDGPGLSLGYALGFVLFTGEIAVLVIAAADLAPKRA